MARIRFEGAPIFIGGDGRSGTTLLSLVLNAHPMLAVGPELHFKGPENLGPYALRCAQLLADGDERAFGNGLKLHPDLKKGMQFVKRCHRYGIGFQELIGLIEEAIRLTGGSKLDRFEHRCVLIDLIGRRRCETTGRRHWGIKIMREIGDLAAYGNLWPDARFLHIIRDGRDVAASQMTEHGTWGYGDIAEAARSWTKLMQQVQRHVGRAPLLELRYEELVHDSEATVRRVLTFLDVPWDPAVLHHTEAAQPLFDNPYNHPSIEQVVRPINESAIGRYRRDLTPDQIECFNRIAKRELAAHGYETEPAPTR